MENPVYRPTQPNSGHGHVFPRPDGAVARCGGPDLCNQCNADLERETNLAAAGGPLDWAPIQPGVPITVPCIAVPEDFQGTAAEAVGLATAGALAGLEMERDEAREALAATRQELVDALVALETLADAFPETSWASDSHALAAARTLLERLAPKPTT